MTRRILYQISALAMMFVLVSCGGNRYYNKKFKYEVTLPLNYVVIEDGIPNERADEMRRRIDVEGALPMYKDVDAAFYDTESSGPVFDTVTVSSLNKPFSMQQLAQSQTVIEAMFLQMLSSQYKDVRLVKSEFETFRPGKAYIASFSFDYQNVPCRACVVLLTSNILFSNLFTMVCPASNEDPMIATLYGIINSYKRHF